MNNESAWQPIKTAPKDGSRLLLATPTGKIADGNWSTRYGVWSWPYVMTDPTHWMPAPPIPNPPKLKPYNPGSKPPRETRSA